MPILIRYAPSSLTREQYDRVNEILQENGPDGPPPPLQLHVMFGEEPDLRVSEVWASEDAWQQAWDGGLKDALLAATASGKADILVTEETDLQKKAAGESVLAWSFEQFHRFVRETAL